MNLTNLYESLQVVAHAGTAFTSSAQSCGVAPTQAVVVGVAADVFVEELIDEIEGVVVGTVVLVSVEQGVVGEAVTQAHRELALVKTSIA